MWALGLVLGMGFRVEGFWVWDLELRGLSVGFRVEGHGCGV